ncbi:GAF domain-containing protein [Crocosphaera sp. UHCC 0190]|uniref:GAF domain-containing protein n=1 Tax=Crocosphaera sp. UHCC 0190 TaxID=3110246 RepID=UPI002B20C7FD|nr:GAF domain-containing protein [Crocosphaera sp. UHCC 0190]MEA5509130.1 GAF domain-containing protein [Crocosphaera sp. UHCC 0190]
MPMKQNPLLMAQQEFLREIVKKIQEFVELEQIFLLTTNQVRQLLKTDRVGIYPLDSNHQGWVSEGSGRSPDIYASQQLPWDHKLEEAYQIYAQPDGLWLVNDFQSVILPDRYCSLVQKWDCQGQIVVPIYKRKQPWGRLLIHHCSQPRYWEETEILFVQQIALHLSIAVEQTEMYQKQQNQAKHLNEAVEQAVQRQETIAKIIDKIRRSLDINTILTTATQEARQLLKADRVAIYRLHDDYSGEFIMESVGEGWTSLLSKQQEDLAIGARIAECRLKLLGNPELSDSYLQSTEGRIFTPQDLLRVCDNIYQAGFPDCYIELIQRYEAQAYIIVALYKNNCLWGLLAAYQNSGPRHWEDAEINFMVQVGVNLGIALQQANLLAQTQQHEEQLQTALETALKQQTETLAKTNQKERSLAIVIDKIRRTLDLNTIFQTAATEVQKLLGVEHIAIYQFDPDYGGKFIFESDPREFLALVGRRWDDEYLQETQGGRFQENHTCVINNIETDDRSSRCHLEILESFGVKSMAVVPLFQGLRLWGLLAGFEHTQSRNWQSDEVQLLQQVAHHVSIALQQTFYVQQIQDYAQEQAIAVQQERALSEVIDKIRRTLDLDTIFQTAVTEVRYLLKADRVAVFQFDPDSEFSLAELVSEDVAAEYISALTAQVEDNCFARHSAPYYQQSHVCTINDVEKADLSDCYRDILAQFQVRANIVAPLLKGEELWGLLCIHQCSGPRQWKTSEKGFITKIATNLSVALQQAELLKQTQERSQALENALEQVQQQKQSLAQIAAQEKALARVIKRIRQRLDLESIFYSTTEEVRQMLQCDRVVVYRFLDNWDGEFLYESLGEGWKPLTGEFGEKPMWEDTYLQETQGGRYRHHETWAIRNIYQAGLTPCHIDILAQFQVRAFVVVPVFVRNQLWGLLGVYQNTGPRSWQKREVNLLKQVANQLGVAIDQTELLTQTQQQSDVLQSTLADLNAIVDNLGDGLLVIDNSGKITRFNPALLSMFNLTEAPQGRQAHEVFPAELSALIEQKKLDQKEVITGEVKLSQERIGQALASNIIKEQGEEREEYLGAVILIRDITKERETERVKDDLLATVSHELRTPLTSVLGFASLIRDKLYKVIFPQLNLKDQATEKALERVKQNLDIIVSESERLTSLVNDVLDMAKMEAGKVEWHFSQVSPSLILERAIAATSYLFEDQNLSLLQDFPPDLPLIFGDEDRLIQVFINLFSNAVKFTEIGSVTCQARVNHQDLLIKITDTGIGIAHNDYGKVFEPFQQVGNILTNKPRGTGLGLSICKQIIERHGGQIWLESQLGKGTIFFVKLPINQLT